MGDRPRRFVRRHSARAVAGLLLLLTIGGCGSAADDPGTATAAASSRTAATSATASGSSSAVLSSSTSATPTSAGSSAAPPSSAGSSESSAPSGPSTVVAETSEFPGNPSNIPWTLPGTRLAFGQPATVGLSFLESDGVFDVTATASTKGTADDWAAMDLAAPAAGAVPWYVELTLTQRSGDAFAGYRPQDRMFALGSDLLPMNRVETSYSRCNNVPAPADYAIGSTFSTCIVFYGTDQLPFTAFGYIGVTTGVSSRYLVDPVTWA